MIYGWDLTCKMNDMWIARMGVDRLLNGRNQPFYNVLVEDGSNRYAAEGSSGLEKISTYQIFYAPEFFFHSEL